MAGLSSTFAPIEEIEEWQVTAYLVAISPQLVATAKLKRQEVQKSDLTKNALDAAFANEREANASARVPQAVSPGSREGFSQPEGYDNASTQTLYEQTCSQCHGLDEVENYGFADEDDVENVLARMAGKPGFEANEAELSFLLYFLKTTFVEPEAFSSLPPNREPRLKKSGGATTAIDPSNLTATDDGEIQPAQAAVALGPAPAFYDPDIAKFLFEKKCSQCHKTSRVAKYEFIDRDNVQSILKQMTGKMEKKGLKINEKEIGVLQYFLESSYVQ